MRKRYYNRRKRGNFKRKQYKRYKRRTSRVRSYGSSRGGIRL